MANTCCFCIGLRPGTIIITALMFISFLYMTSVLPYMSGIVLTIYTVSSENGIETKTSTQIDTSPQAMDYIFLIVLLVVTFAMLLSAILRKSEILFYALITYIILLISLIVYSSLGEEKGSLFQFKFPPTLYRYVYTGRTDNVSNIFELRAWPKSVSSIYAMIQYVISGYFLYVVYSYVQQLRQAVRTSGQVISA